jgi:hypothetical protein
MEGVDGFTLIDMIKESIEILMNMRAEEDDFRDLRLDSEIRHRYKEIEDGSFELHEDDIVLPDAVKQALKDVSGEKSI